MKRIERKNNEAFIIKIGRIKIFIQMKEVTKQ